MIIKIKNFIYPKIIHNKRKQKEREYTTKIYINSICLFNYRTITTTKKWFDFILSKQMKYKKKYLEQRDKKLILFDLCFK